MLIAVPRESDPDEPRVAATPATVAELSKLGAKIIIESGLGQSIQESDEAYKEAGAEILTDRKKLVSEAEIVIRVRSCPAEEVTWMKKGAVHISYFEVLVTTASSVMCHK